MIDEKLFAELVELWESNVKLFKQQHLGFLFDKIYPLNKEDIEKIIKNVREGYSTQVDLVPDVSWELRR